LSVNKRLLEVRKSEGLTQAAFAKKFGVSSRAYASYELGERELPSTFIVKLNSELGVNPNWLLTGKGAKTPELSNVMLIDAIVAVRTFAMFKKLKIDPEDEADLAILLLEYFQEGGSKDAAIVNKILEKVT